MPRSPCFVLKPFVCTPGTDPEKTTPNMYLQSSVEWHILTCEGEVVGLSYLKEWLAFLQLREAAFEERKEIGRSLGSGECTWGGQEGRLELKRPHPCFSRCPFCNISLFF